MGSGLTSYRPLTYRQEVRKCMKKRAHLDHYPKTTKPSQDTAPAAKLVSRYVVWRR